MPIATSVPKAARSTRSLQTLQIAALIGATTALSLAINRARGTNRDPWALPLLAASVGLATLAWFMPDDEWWPALSRHRSTVLTWLFAAGIGTEVYFMFVESIPVYHRPGAFVPLCAVLVGLAGGLLTEAPPIGRIQLPLFLAIHTVLCLMTVAHSNTAIDVRLFQDLAADGLSRGANPYTIQIPNIYGPGAYGAGLVVRNFLQFGFPYPPIILAFIWPARALFGDHRFAEALALPLTGALMAYARPDRMARGAMLLFLVTPSIFFVIDSGWTEPLVLLLLAAFVFCWIRWPRAVPWALGAFLASKQYLALVLPLLPLVASGSPEPKFYRRTVVLALALAAAVTLPFVLWNPSAFIGSVVTLQFRQPFRHDSLSFLTMTQAAPLVPYAAAISFAAAGLAIVIALWRAPHSLSGFLAGVGWTMLMFLAVNKQAFCNYYFFVIGAWCLALATTEDVPSTSPDRREGRQSAATWRSSNSTSTMSSPASSSSR